jgi:hypothetical protein
MELHAKTSVRDTCFWFRVERSAAAPRPSDADSLDAQKALNTGASSSPAAPAYLYGWVEGKHWQGGRGAALTSDARLHARWWLSL